MSEKKSTQDSGSKLPEELTRLKAQLRQANTELAYMNRLVEHILLTTSDIIYTYDFKDEHLDILSRTSGPFLGYPLEKLAEMDGAALQSLVHPDELNRLGGHYEDCLNAKDGDVLDVEVRLRHSYGEWHWIAIRETPFERSPDGGVGRILGMAEDITTGRLAQEKIWYLSTHDSLTGLYNRAYYQEELARLEHGRRFPVTVLIADVDNLKDVNNTRGYAAGDALLRNAAEALAACFRVEDAVARIGGNEFGVLLPEIASISIDAIQVRINRRFEMFNKSHPNSPVHISFGLASAEHGSDLRETVREAERRMVARKQAKGENDSGLQPD
jgi:diguanylate cyclase (GGDEF)-like protein/PAS domain S-box-containing protein